MDSPRSQDSATKFATTEPSPPSGILYETDSTTSAPGPAGISQTAPTRQPTPLAPLAPIVRPSSVHSTKAFTSSAAPQTPPRFPVPIGSPAQPTLTEPMTTNAGAGPSNLPRLASMTEEFDEQDYTGSADPEGTHQPSVRSIHSRSNRGGDEYEDRNETHGPTVSNNDVRSANIRPSERTSRHPSILSAPPTIDSQYLLSRPLEIWSAQAPLGQDPVKGRSNAMAHNMIASFAGGWTERTVGERIACTLDAAKQGRHKADIRGKISGHAS